MVFLVSMRDIAAQVRSQYRLCFSQALRPAYPVKHRDEYAS